MKDNNTIIGIDIAKNHFDVCILPLNKTKRFKNNAIGIEDFIEFTNKFGTPQKIILEPTGGYEALVIDTLYEKGFKVCKINASQIRSFARACGTLAKTDKIDAYVLADYGSKMECREYIPLPPKLKQLRKLVLRRKQLVHMMVEEKNRLKKENDETIKSYIQSCLEYMTKQRKEIEIILQDIADQDKELRAIKEVLMSLKGIGDLTAITLMVELPELGKLTKGQIAKLIGVAPLNRDSGMMRGKAKIYGGRGFVRDSLYFAALPAIRFEPVLREFYQRLRNNGKPGKLAVIAVIHKMITILNARLRDFYH
jgi:transposase